MIDFVRNIADIASSRCEMVFVDSLGFRPVCDKVATSFDSVWDTYCDQKLSGQYIHGYDEIEINRLKRQADRFIPTLFPLGVYRVNRGVIADVGCGPGYVARYLLGSVQGFDLEPLSPDVIRWDVRESCPVEIKFPRVFASFLCEHLTNDPTLVGESLRELGWKVSETVIDITLTGDDLSLVTDMLRVPEIFEDGASFRDAFLVTRAYR